MMKARFAAQHDLPALAEIHLAAWRAAYRGMMPSAFLDSLDASHALVRLEPVILARPPRLCVVELQDEIIAFCRFGPSTESDVPPHTCEVYALNVEPRHWRKGAGRCLTERVVAEARARGFTTCTLWVLRDNTRARSFYEALGFCWDGATRTEAANSDHPLHEARYRRSL